MSRFVGARVRWAPSGAAAAEGIGVSRGETGLKARQRWNLEALRRDSAGGPVLRSGLRSAQGGLKRFLPVRAHWAVSELEPRGASRGLSTEGVPCLSVVSEGVQGEAEVTE